MTGPPPSSPSKLPAHYLDDMDHVVGDDSTRATSNLRTSCIGFSTPSQNSQREKNMRMSTGGVEAKRAPKMPKFNLEQDSLVKKTADTYKYIYDEESQDGIPTINYLDMDKKDEVSKFNIAEIGSLEEIDENDELQLTHTGHRYVRTQKNSCQTLDQATTNGSPSFTNSNRRVKHIDKIRLSRVKSSSIVSQDGDISLLSSHSHRRSSLRESLLRNHLIKRKKKSCCTCNLI